MPAIDCIDQGFPLSQYLQAQQQELTSNQSSILLQMNSKLNLVRPDLNDSQWAQMFFGSGHNWANLGSRCWRPSQRETGPPKRGSGVSGHPTTGQASPRPLVAVLSPDPSGCRPFQGITRRFRALYECFETHVGPALGPWMEGRHQQEYFEQYHMTPGERLLLRLAMFAAKGDAGSDVSWLKNIAKFQSTFSLEQRQDGTIDRALKCVTQAQMHQRDFKCYIVLMGAPGFSGLTVQDHVGPEDVNVRPDPKKTTQTCDVPRVCGRLGLQYIHHFQGLYFDQKLLRGWTKLRKTKSRTSWVGMNNDTTTMVNRVCNAKNPGQILCWNFTECLQQMLKRVCAEHPSCCPSTRVYESCKGDIRSKACSVCSKPRRGRS